MRISDWSSDVCFRSEILPGRGAICPARPADHAAVRARLQRLARASFGRLHRVVDPDIFVERSIGFGRGGHIAAGVESDLGPRISNMLVRSLGSGDDRIAGINGTGGSQTALEQGQTLQINLAASRRIVAG